MAKDKTTELEDVLLNQIEMLNDDSLLENPEKAKLAIEKSKSIAELTNSFIGVRGSVQAETRLKLDAVKIAMDADGYRYSKFLGIEEDSPKSIAGRK